MDSYCTVGNPRFLQWEVAVFHQAGEYVSCKGSPTTLVTALKSIQHLVHTTTWEVRHLSDRLSLTTHIPEVHCVGPLPSGCHLQSDVNLLLKCIWCTVKMIIIKCVGNNFQWNSQLKFVMYASSFCLFIVMMYGRLVFMFLLYVKLHNGFDM